MDTIYFSRKSREVKLPTKRAEDAGFDIYPYFEDDFIIIRPHSTAMIPTGLYSACSPSYCFILKERGSTGSKGIAQRCGVIDSGYRGEWFVPLTNTTNKDMIICREDFLKNGLADDIIVYPYEKAIAQALVVPVPEVTVLELPLGEIQAITSERGSGALGSSNK